MRNCLGCHYAQWDRMDDGQVHPNGKGECRYPLLIVELPAVYELKKKPINARRDNDRDCTYWTSYK